jgi:hypothetical protein
MCLARLKVITGSVGEILLQTDVAFCRLDRRMPERNLDLLERRMTLVGQLRKGAAQIVRGYLHLDLFSAGGKSMSQTLL